MPRPSIVFGLLGLALLTGPAAAQTVPCQKDLSFNRWMEGVKKEALSEGVSPRVVSGLLDGVGFAKNIVGKDRAQSVFSQTFLEFIKTRVTSARLQTGAQLIKKHGKIFNDLEATYGVPAPVIVAFWGLETDFGKVTGNLPTIPSLAALAYDCRRPERFRPELIAALKLVDGGDLSASELRGAWAGELGHFQFLPTYFLKHAVDYDGDGRRDPVGSTSDALASAANYLKNLGWQRGQPWIEEVIVPDNLAWEQADLAITHPRAKWAKAGLVRATGEELTADDLPAALILPMGRNGPAFLAYDNFRNVYLTWNESLTYALTAAYNATRLAGAPPVSKGRGTVVPFGYKEILALQKLLVARGYDVGKADGKLGALTRKSVKAAQIKLGLPADSYPTPELLKRLQAGEG
ncbi:MAG: lytic murein transglycosylase [Hyphomicrobiaceae bacterium]